VYSTSDRQTHRQRWWRLPDRRCREVLRMERNGRPDAAGFQRYSRDGRAAGSRQAHPLQGLYGQFLALTAERGPEGSARWRHNRHQGARFVRRHRRDRYPAPSICESCRCTQPAGGMRAATRRPQTESVSRSAAQQKPPHYTMPAFCCCSPRAGGRCFERDYLGRATASNPSRAIK